MINGAAAQIDGDMTVAELIASRVDASRHVAVALNGAVVSRGVWDATRLQPGDTVEVLAPVAGG
jgi:sulfur carrier protein